MATEKRPPETPPGETSLPPVRLVTQVQITAGCKAFIETYLDGLDIYETELPYVPPWEDMDLTERNMLRASMGAALGAMSTPGTIKVEPQLEEDE